MRFLLQDDVGVQVVAGAGTIVNDENDEPVLQYAWGAPDTEAPGDFYGEFEVTIGGLRESFPPGSYIRVTIQPKSE